MSQEPATKLLQLSDEQLDALHKSLDAKPERDNTTVELHHLVTTEIGRRGGAHGHIDDEWSFIEIEVDKSLNVDLRTVAESLPLQDRDGFIKELGLTHGDVTVVLTVDGYEMRVDPSSQPLTPAEKLEKTIRYRQGKYVIYDAEGKKELGRYDTLTEAKRRLKQIEYFSKSSRTFKPPSGVQEAAQRAVEWIRDGKAGDGFTAVGRKRASQLATGQSVSLDTLLRMRSYFARHAVDKKAEGFSQGEEGFPSAGRVAWDAWGGDAGRVWVEEILDQELSKSYDPSQDLNERQKALYAAIEGVVMRYGCFDESSGANGAHYMDAEHNPFSHKGMKCSNCVFYLGGGGCEILENKVDPEGLCKLWIIPESMIGAREYEDVLEEILKHGDHDQSSHGRAGGKKYEAMAERRKQIMDSGQAGKVGLPRDADGKVICPEATGGYKAGIPEVVQLEGVEEPLTPEHSLWHHLEADPDNPGSYRVTEERARVHRQIVEEATAGVPASDDPTFILLGGGPASGKTTALESGMIEGVPAKGQAVIINADNAKEGLPEFNRMRYSNNDQEFFNAAAFSHEESSLIAAQVQRAALRNRQNAILDGTGDSNYRKLENKVIDARNAGYKINAVYVTIDTNEAVGRARSRSLNPKERRYVPESIVRNTHSAVSATLPQAVAAGIFDNVTLIDNNERTPRVVGRWKTTGKKTVVSGLDSKLYRRFLSKNPAYKG